MLSRACKINNKKIKLNFDTLEKCEKKCNVCLNTALLVFQILRNRPMLSKKTKRQLLILF